MVVKCSCAGGELDGSDSSPLLDIAYLVISFFNGYLIDNLVDEKAKYNLEK